MKKIKKNILSVTLIAVIFFASTGSSLILQNINFDFNKLKKKSYYEKIFDANEIKQLAKLEKKYNKGASKMKKAESLFSKAEGYELLAKEAEGNRKEKKYIRKSARYNKRALRNSFKGYALLFAPTEAQYDIYRGKLKKMEKHDSPEHKLAEKLSDTAKIIFKKGIKQRKKAEKKTGNKKNKLYKKAYNLCREAIEKQELAFGLYKYDPEIDMDKTTGKQEKDKKNEKNKKDKKDKENKKKDVKKDDKKENKEIVKKSNIPEYDIDKDPNLYRSKDKIILPELDLNEHDQAQIKKSNEKIDYANKLMKNVDELYAKINLLKDKIKKEKSTKKKNLLKQDAETLEMGVFVKMNKAANSYFDANVIKYKIYLKNISKIRKNKKAPIVKIAKNYERSADSLFAQAKTINAQAKLAYNMYASVKYRTFMNALQTILAAIQEQENAYCTYFGFPTDTLQGKNGYSLSVENEDLAKKDEKGTKNKGKKVTDKAKKSNPKYLGSYVYSVSKPKPEKLKHKKGIIFKIQVGVFKELLPLGKYGIYSPISFDAFKNNPLRRFMLCEFRSSEAAEHVLKKIKAKGMKSAYIIGYIDGKRFPYSTAKARLVINDEYKKNKKKELASFTEKPESVDDSSKPIAKKKSVKIKYGTKKYDFAKGKDVTKTKGLIYGIQLGLFSLPKTNHQLKQIRPLLEIKTSQGTKFLKGPYYTYESANSDKIFVIEKGFESAYIKAFLNGKQIPTKEARKKQKKVVTRKKATEPKSDIYFAVQIGAFSSEVSGKSKKQFQEIAKKYTISKKTDKNGLFIYIVGKNTVFQKTVNHKKELQKAGYSDVFVVAFNKNEKIPVGKALELLKK